MNYNEVYNVLYHLFIEWQHIIEEDCPKISLWEFIAQKLLEICDITVKE